MKTVKKENPAVPIPQPPKWIVIGNIASIKSLCTDLKRYGLIVRMTIQKAPLLGVKEIVNEICDENRFKKIVGDPLLEIRELAGDGLFTAQTFPEEQAEPNWGKAHRILMLAFCPRSIQSMFPDMLEIGRPLYFPPTHSFGEQMFLKWETGPEEPFDMLALDAIGFSLFHYRLNNFRGQDTDPFVYAMVNGLKQSIELKRRSKVFKLFSGHKIALYKADVSFMFSVAGEMIAERKRAGLHGKVNDLLQKMSEGRDPVSNEGLSDQNIRYDLITFLIVGHETTSGLLSFTFYYLLKNPDVMQKARGEVDRVLEYRIPTIEDIPKLIYVDQILKESLCLQPTALAFTLAPVEPLMVAGKYYVEPGERLTVLLPALHRDPKAWSTDAEEFKPEPMAPELWVKLEQNSWKPFEIWT